MAERRRAKRRPGQFARANLGAVCGRAEGKNAVAADVTLNVLFAQKEPVMQDRVADDPARRGPPL